MICVSTISSSSSHQSTISSFNPPAESGIYYAAYHSGSVIINFDMYQGVRFFPYPHKICDCKGIAVTLTGLRNCYLCRTEIRIVYPAVSGIECVILYQKSVIDRVIEHDFPVKHEVFQHQSRGIVNGIRHDHIIL